MSISTWRMEKKNIAYFLPLELVSCITECILFMKCRLEGLRKLLFLIKCSLTSLRDQFKKKKKKDMLIEVI